MTEGLNPYNSDTFRVSILNSLKEAIVVRDLSGKILFANNAAGALFGMDKEILTDKSIEFIIPHENLEDEKKLLQSLLFGEPIENYETARIRSDGQLIKVFINLSPLKDETGKVYAVLSVLRSAADQKRSEGKFQSLLESAPDAMVITNKAGQIVLVNAQTEKLFGYNRNELIGHTVEILIPQQYKGIHPEHRKHYMNEPRVREMGAGLELFALHKDGHEFPVEISLSPLQLDDGIFVSAAIRDTTNQKKAARELKEYASRLEFSNRELEQFAYVASHDLQEPLRNITNFVSMLEESFNETLSDDVKYFLKVITSSTTRMKALISDLLGFSRIGRNRIIQEVDCTQVLNEVLTDMSVLIKENNALVTGKNLPVVRYNPRELKQLFQNLISNSIKFRKKELDPVIEINCMENESEWEFAFSDNGIGIDQEYLSKIFLIFQRLHSEKEYPGTGIGLATCKKIVESNEGRIWVNSQPDEGTTFYFTIPKTITLHEDI